MPKGKIQLHSSFTVVLKTYHTDSSDTPDLNSENNTFQIVHQMGTFTFRAETRDEYDLWVNCIGKAIASMGTFNRPSNDDNDDDDNDDNNNNKSNNNNNIPSNNNSLLESDQTDGSVKQLPHSWLSKTTSDRTLFQKTNEMMQRAKSGPLGVELSARRKKVIENNDSYSKNNNNNNNSIAVSPRSPVIGGTSIKGHNYATIGAYGGSTNNIKFMGRVGGGIILIIIIK